MLIMQMIIVLGMETRDRIYWMGFKGDGLLKHYREKSETCLFVSTSQTVQALSKLL